MNPILALPGWTGFKTWDEYAQYKSSSPDTSIATILRTLMHQSITSVVHIRLYHDTYTGKEPVSGLWQTSLFGFDTTLKMKMCYNDEKPTLFSCTETGELLSLMTGFNKSLIPFMPIAENIRTQTVSEYTMKITD